jgi:hypothetical protein
MSSIDFFAPVIYKNPIKTGSEQALEMIDEYFYLGNTSRVTIFAPDSAHPQSWAMKNRHDRHRSWTNIAIKVASYCTVIIPLVALLGKAILRCSLKVSSIKVEQQFVPGIFVPSDVLQEIGSFLSYPDQGKLAQVAMFTRNAALHAQRYYIKLMAPFKTEIEALPPEPLTDAHFQRLLVELVTSHAAGHPKHWVPLMDSLMGHLGPHVTVNDIVQKHARIADLLATSKKPISPDKIYQFCKYLGVKQLSKTQPWIGYRALEQYALNPQLDSPSVNQALKEYLTQQANRCITAVSDAFFLPGQRMLNFQTTTIDPRQWFGLNREEHSLWAQPGVQNDQTAPMPELLLDVLWTRIQSLRASCRDMPFEVSMCGREEAELPNNFTLTLAQRVTNADIFLDHGETITSGAIETFAFENRLRLLSIEEMGAWAREHYPNAIVSAKIPDN